MKIVSFVETKSTVVTPMKFNVRLVDSISGNPSIGEFFEVPQNHLNICKPETRFVCAVYFLLTFNLNDF